MTELWKFAWQLRSFHDLTIWNLTIWNKWKYCIRDKQQFDKGQIETGQIEKWHFWKGIFELALPKGHFDEGHIWKGISERAFWWRALKGRSFWGKGISEGRKGKGHEGHCAQTRISPMRHPGTLWTPWEVVVVGFHMCFPTLLSPWWVCHWPTGPVAE